MDEFCIEFCMNTEFSFKPFPLLRAAYENNTHEASFYHDCLFPGGFIVRSVLLWDFMSTFEVKNKYTLLNLLWTIFDMEMWFFFL